MSDVTDVGRGPPFQILEEHVRDGLHRGRVALRRVWRRPSAGPPQAAPRSESAPMGLVSPPTPGDFLELSGLLPRVRPTRAAPAHPPLVSPSVAMCAGAFPVARTPERDGSSGSWALKPRVARAAAAKAAQVSRGTAAKTSHVYMGGGRLRGGGRRLASQMRRPGYVFGVRVEPPCAVVVDGPRA